MFSESSAVVAAAYSLVCLAHAAADGDLAAHDLRTLTQRGCIHPPQCWRRKHIHVKSDGRVVAKFVTLQVAAARM